MKLKKIGTLFIGAMLCLFSLAGCGKPSNSSSNNSSTVNEDPYAKVTLTEAGAARVNAAINRQNNVRQRYAKYSSWLSTKLAAPQTRAAVVEGDPVEEDMNFEIYPADLNALDSMFLIGRTKANAQQPQNLRGGLLAAEPEEPVENLIEIETNIPAEELSNYNLNGSIHDIDIGLTGHPNSDINHDKIDFDALPYQTTTEFTMVYTYVKKGTSADSSPYSCQPSFNLTKVDNEAPKQKNDSNLHLEVSYTKTVAELKESIINYVKSNFSINDASLEMTVTILNDDSALTTAMENSITAAKNDSAHQFPQFNVSVRVSTVNNSTDPLDCSVLLVDDINPTLRRGGAESDSLVLNGGIDLKLPHIDVINSGATNLLETEGYIVWDEIEGTLPTIDFDINDEGYLTTNISVNKVNRIVVDNTTKFSIETSARLGQAAHTVDSGYIWYHLNYKATDHNCLVELLGTETDVVIVNPYEFINKGTAFEEKLIASSFNGRVRATKALVLNLDRPVTFEISVWSSDTKVYFSSASASASYCGSDSTYTASAANVYTDAESYNTTDWYYNSDAKYTFFGPVDSLNFNYKASLSQFIEDFCK